MFDIQLSDQPEGLPTGEELERHAHIEQEDHLQFNQPQYPEPDYYSNEYKGVNTGRKGQYQHERQPEYQRQEEEIQDADFFSNCRYRN
jgi:hypothetical protein